MPTQILSHAHIDFQLSAHLFEGYADEERPIEFSDGGDRVETKVGKDGGLYGTTMMKLGDDVTVRLQPTSPSVAQCLRWNEEQKQAEINKRAIRKHDGSYRDTVQGRSITLEGGWMVKCPSQAEPGITFEVMFRFERTLNDGAGDYAARRPT